MQQIGRYKRRVKSSEQRLKLSVRRVEELRDKRMVREQMWYHLSLNFNHTSGLSVQFNEPDEEVLHSFLMTFRMFIAEKESTFIFSGARKY